jgi:hypothetical protein
MHSGVCCSKGMKTLYVLFIPGDLIVRAGSCKPVIFADHEIENMLFCR